MKGHVLHLFLRQRKAPEVGGGVGGLGSDQYVTYFFEYFGGMIYQKEKEMLLGNGVKIEVYSVRLD